MRLTADFRVVPRSVGGTLPPLLLYDFLACSKTTLPLSEDTLPLKKRPKREAACK